MENSTWGGGDLFQLGSCSEGWLKLKSCLEKPSDKVSRSRGPISCRIRFVARYFSFLISLGLLLNTKIHFQHPPTTTTTNFYMMERYQESQIRYVSFTTGRLQEKKDMTNLGFWLRLGGGLKKNPKKRVGVKIFSEG